MSRKQVNYSTLTKLEIHYSHKETINIFKQFMFISTAKFGMVYFVVVFSFIKNLRQ